MDISLNWANGIDNVSAQTRLPEGHVADAANVEIDKPVDGKAPVSRRPGYSVLSATRAHSLWTSPARDESFAVIAGVLSRIRVPYAATTALQTLATDLPMSYCDHNGAVAASSTREAFLIASDLTVRRLGLPRAAPCMATAAAAGGLAAGLYGVVVAFLSGDEEGPPSRVSFCELTDGQGLSLTIPQSSEATKVRIYRTNANGDELFRVADIAIGITSYTLGFTNIGRQITTLNQDRMLPGDFIRSWRGLLWTVQGNVATHSEPMNYGLYDPRFNRIQFPSLIRVFEPVEGGIHVGTKDGTFFLAGAGPKEFSLRRTGGMAPIAGTGRRFNASLLKEGAGEYAMWLAPNGFVLGGPDGAISEPQDKRIRLSGSTGSIAIHDSRVTALVQ